MPSLSAHLRQPERHGELPFHADCPFCQETRLVGTLSTGGLVSRRTQAVLAASLLAVSTIAPAATALAAGESDQQQEGTAPVAPTGGGDQAANPNFDPGGASTDLPDAAPQLPATSAPADAGNDDTAPVEQAPTVNPSDPVVDIGDGSGPTTSPGTPTDGAAPQVAEPTPSPAPTSSPPTAPVDTTPAETRPGAWVPPASTKPATVEPKALPDKQHGSRTEPEHHGLAQQRVARPTIGGTAPSAPSPVAAAPTATAPVPTTATLVAATTVPTHQVGTQRARRGDRSHTVQPGESLWLIAGDVLGEGATPARIAREVHRLWTLNRERIGTGDPNVLMVGTKLVLR
jgi:hypothetical protein